MKQLGNLAVICAKRKDTIFLMRNGMVSVIVHHINGNGTKTLDAKWDDDEAIEGVCHELNFGMLSGGGVE